MLGGTDATGEDFVDAQGIAERLGLKSTRTVLDLRVHRLGFPAPVTRFGRTLVWSWPEVACWADDALSALPGSFFRSGVGDGAAETHRRLDPEVAGRMPGALAVG